MTSQKAAPVLDEELESKIEADGERRLTPAEWAEIVELWELGTVDAEEICERFKIKPATLRKRLLRNGIKKGTRAAEVAAAAGAGVKAAAKAATAPAPTPTAEEAVRERKEKIDTTRSLCLEWNQTLMKAAMGRLASAQRDGRPFATEDGNLKAIERAMKIVKMGREEAWDLLGAHDEVDDKELPELTIRNLTDEQIKALRDKQEEDDGDLVEDGDTTLTAEDDGIVEESDDGAA